MKLLSDTNSFLMAIDNLIGEITLRNSLVKFSAENILKYFFLIFPWKQGSAFHAACLQGDIIHKKYQIQLSGKSKKH